MQLLSSYVSTIKLNINNKKHIEDLFEATFCIFMVIYL